MNEKEKKELLDRIKDRLIAEGMDISNVEGRVISIVNEELSKKSGGIMMSPKDEGSTSFEGVYYNLDELMEALNDYIENGNEKRSTTVERKGKIELDKEAVDKAIHEASSLYVEKQQTKRRVSFYGVSRSNENSDEVKKSGGLITPEGMDVKEGQYISEDGAKAMMDGLIEVPTKEEVIEAIKEIPEQEKITTTVTRKRLSPELMERLKKYAKRATAIIGIGLVIITATPDIIGGEDFIPPEPEDVIELIDEEEIGNNDLEIGDVVELEEGVKFDHNSQGDDGLHGVIGENEREAGDYTVDVISIMDEDGNLIDYTSDRDGSLEKLLEENGYTMDDVRSGKISVRYNVSEGINEDLDRSESAGWIDYNQDNYHDKGNVIQDNLKELNGGMNI